MNSINKRWNDYMRSIPDEYNRQLSIDIVNTCLINSRYPPASPLSVKSGIKITETDIQKVKTNVQKHCDALGLKCKLIKDGYGKFSSGSCLEYRELLFDITGYPEDIHKRYWSNL